MTTMINRDVAAAHIGELHRAAEQRRLAVSDCEPGAVELRVAKAADAAAVHRLAILDEEPELQGPVLVALIDGVAAAALSLEDGRVVANPFVATLGAVALLRVRAAQVAQPRGRRRVRAAQVAPPRGRRGLRIGRLRVA